jgi:hypothetical protein
MTLTLLESVIRKADNMVNRGKKRKKQPRPIVPREYGGKWITWNQDGSKILSSGETLKEARDAAIAAGEEDPVLEWVPPGLMIGLLGCPFQDKSIPESYFVPSLSFE